MSADSIGLDPKYNGRYIKSPTSLTSRSQVRDLQEELHRKDIELQLIQEELKKSTESVKQYQVKVAELSTKLISREDDFYALSEKIEKLKEQHDYNLQSIKDQLTNYNIDISLLKGTNSNESEDSTHEAAKQMSGSLLISPILRSPSEPVDWKSQEFQKEADILKEKLVLVTRERDAYKAWKENHLKESQEMESYLTSVKSKMRRIGRALKSFTMKGAQLHGQLDTNDPAVKKSLNAFYEEKLELESVISELAGQNEKSSRRRKSPDRLIQELSKKKQEVEQLAYNHAQTVEDLHTKLEESEQAIRILKQEKESLKNENKEFKNIFIMQKHQLDQIKKEYFSAGENMMIEYKILVEANKSLVEEKDNLILQRNQINEKFQKEMKYAKRLSADMEELQSKIVKLNGTNNVLESQIEFYRKELSSFEENRQKGENDLTNRHTFEMKDAEEKIAMKEKEIFELKINIESLQKQIVDIEEERKKKPTLSLMQIGCIYIEQPYKSQQVIEELSHQLTEKERIINDYISELKFAKNKVKELEKSLSEKEKIISASKETFEHKLKHKEDEITNIKTQIEERPSRIGGVRKKTIAATLGEANEMEKSFQSADSSAVSQKINSLEKDMNDLQKEKRKWEKEKKSLEAEKNKLFEDSQSSKGRVMMLEAENKDLMKQIVELMDGIKQYEEIIQRIETQNSQSEVKPQPIVVKKSGIKKVFSLDIRGIANKAAINEQNSQVEKLRNELKVKGDQMAKEIDGKNKAIQSLKEKYEKTINEISKELDEKKDVCEKLLKEKAQLEKSAQEKMSVKNRCEKRIKSLEMELGEKLSLLQQVEKEKETLSYSSEEINLLSKEKEALTKKLTQANQENKRLIDRLAEIERVENQKLSFEPRSEEIEPILKEKDAITKKLQQAEERIKTLNEERLGIEDLSKLLAEKTEKLEEENREMNKLLMKVKKELFDSKDEIRKLVKDKKEFENKFEENEEKIRNLTHTNEEAQKKIKDLENKSKIAEKDKKQDQELETRIENYEKIVKEFENLQKINGEIEARLQNYEKKGKLQDELLKQIQELSIAMQSSEKRNKDLEERLRSNQELELKLQNSEKLNKQLSDEVFEIRERLGILEFEKNELLIENDVVTGSPEEDSSKVLLIKISKQKQKLKELKNLIPNKNAMNQIQNQILFFQNSLENQLKQILARSEKLLVSPNLLISKFLSIKAAWSAKNSSSALSMKLKEKAIGLEAENNSLRLQINSMKKQFEDSKNQLENSSKSEMGSLETQQKIENLEKEKADLNAIINRFSAQKFPQKVEKLEKENFELSLIIKKFSSEDFPQKIAKLEKEKSDLTLIINKLNSEDLQLKISKLEKEKSDLNFVMKKLSSDYEKLLSEKDDLNKNKALIEAEKTKLLETRDKLLIQCNKQQDELEELKSVTEGISEFQQKFDELVQENIRLTNEMQKAGQVHEEEADKLRQQFDEINTKYESRERLMKASLENKSKQVSNLIEENAKLKNKINIFTSENPDGNLKDELEKLQFKNMELENKLQEEIKNHEETEKVKESFNGQIKEIAGQVNEFQKKVSGLEFEKAQMEKIIDSIAKELMISNSELQKVKSEYAGFKEKAGVLPEEKTEEAQSHDEFLHEELSASISNLKKENEIIRIENKRLKRFFDKIEPHLTESDQGAVIDLIKQAFSEFKLRMLVGSPKYDKPAQFPAVDSLEAYISPPKIIKEIPEIYEESSSFVFGDESLFNASSFDSSIKIKPEAPLAEDYKNIIEKYEEDFIEKERIIKELEEKIKRLENGEKLNDFAVLSI
ncbi:unnamed protein product [Blepharisma stoltei]|uniref:Uncharacterized protein n=1 Tax=Blepharisma stoltei TaxID=1481888 RepID=A0AAU9KCS6_9CILI|nr:unnamed protein product [Blepharisma stoltei]